jgi:hypothetical protein
LHWESVEEEKEKNQPLTRWCSRSLDLREKTWSGDKLPDHVSETDIDSNHIPYEVKGKWKVKSVMFADTPQLNNEPLKGVKLEPVPVDHDFSEIYEQIRKHQEQERCKKKELEKHYKELETHGRKLRLTTRNWRLRKWIFRRHCASQKKRLKKLKKRENDLPQKLKAERWNQQKCQRMQSWRIKAKGWWSELWKERNEEGVIHH